MQGAAWSRTPVPHARRCAHAGGDRVTFLGPHPRRPGLPCARSLLGASPQGAGIVLPPHSGTPAWRPRGQSRAEPAVLSLIPRPRDGERRRSEVLLPDQEAPRGRTASPGTLRKAADSQGGCRPCSDSATHSPGLGKKGGQTPRDPAVTPLLSCQVTTQHPHP